MTELNDRGREIWFRRVLWSYMPSHWKGVAYPLAVIAAAVLLSLLADDYSSIWFLPAIPILSAWAFVMWLCERHSPSRW